MTKKPGKSPKNLIIIALSVIFLIISGFVIIKIFSPKAIENSSENAIVLDSKYQKTDGKQIEISKITEDVNSYLNDLIGQEKSFVVYVSLPICTGDAARFKEFVHDFQKDKSLSFLYLTSDYVKDTMIYDTVQYFPSVIIFDKGKIVKYLRYDSDEDAEYYKSYDGFSKWFNQNVKY